MSWGLGGGGSNWFIADLTSFSLNFLTGASSWPGVSRPCKISCSSTDISELYGLKTFAKCCASTFAFCLSLFALSSSSVLSRGMGVCGHFSLLVAFYSEYSVASVAVKLCNWVWMAFCFSSCSSCFSSFTALFSFALSCGDLVFCHRFLICLFSRIFCLIIGAHSSMLIDLWWLGVEYQFACCIVLTNWCTKTSVSLLALRVHLG